MFDNPAHMEPLFPKKSKDLVELAMKVYTNAAELTGMVHPLTRAEIDRTPLRFHIPAKVIGYYFPDLCPAGSI